jgi:hypothetical protein
LAGLRNKKANSGIVEPDQLDNEPDAFPKLTALTYIRMARHRPTAFVMAFVMAFVFPVYSYIFSIA